MSLLRDAQGAAALNVPLTLVVERPDGIEYRRVAVPDQGVGGHSLDVPINAAAPTGTWRVRAFTDPKRPAVGETTFLVEDYVRRSAGIRSCRARRKNLPQRAGQADASTAAISTARRPPRSISKARS